MPSLKDLLDDLLSGDDNRAEQSARSFADFSQEGLQALLELTSSKETDTRWWALRALACFPAKEYPEAGHSLVSGLGDPDASVRACAATGLRQNPIPEAVPQLIALLDDHDQLLARLAADALAALKTEASPALIAYLEKLGDQHSNGKVEAVRALALIGDPASITILFKVWENGSSMVQFWAERGLDDMGLGMSFFNPGA